MDFATHRTLSDFSDIMDYILLSFYEEDEVIRILNGFQSLIQTVNDKMSLSKSIKKSCQEKLNSTVEHIHARNLVEQGKLETFVRDMMPESVKSFEKEHTNCPTCDKSFGIFGYVSAKLSGEVSETTKNARIEICKTCDAVDSKGERLYRVIDDVAYCGVPRLKKLSRAERVDGCGCDLSDKTIYRKSKCPKDKWGHSD